MNAFRIERDLLGELPIPAAALHGIHTARAVENFPLTGGRCPGTGARLRHGEAGLRPDQPRAGRLGGRCAEGRCHRACLPRS